MATYTVINIKETDKKTYVITALNYDRNKYAAVEDPEDLLPEKNINILRKRLDPPNIPADGIKEEIFEERNEAVSRLVIDWEPVDGAATYQVVYTKDDENPESRYTTNSRIEIVPSQAGTYEVKIVAINANGVPSQPREVTVPCVAFTEPPENPTNFEIETLNNEQVRLSWSQTTSLDVLRGGSCLIRHSRLNFSSASFNNSSEITTNVNGATTEVIVPAFSGTYSLKFKDKVGQTSVTEAKVALTLPVKDDQLLVKEVREQTAFSGTKTNVAVTAGALTIDNLSSSLNGSYQFSIFDLENIYEDIRFARHLIPEGYNVSDLFDDIPDVDARQDFDGGGTDQVGANLTIQFSNDNSFYSPPTPQKLFNAYFTGRYFKFIANLLSTSTNENIKLNELGFDAFFQIRVERNYKVLDGSGNPTTTTGYGPLQSGTSSSGLNVYYANPFFTGTTALNNSTTAFMPTISITPYNLLTVGSSSNITFDISAETREKFNIIFKNSSGNPVDVKFAFQAVGYGKGIN